MVNILLNSDECLWLGQGDGETPWKLSCSRPGASGRTVVLCRYLGCYMDTISLLFRKDLLKSILNVVASLISLIQQLK